MRRTAFVFVRASLGSARLTPQWQVVSDSKGVTTRARIDSESKLCAVHGTALVSMSVAELMSVFMDLEHYSEWDNTLVEARDWTDEEGHAYLYQRFQQPWPVRDRELVLRRTQHVSENVIAMQYESVDDGTPVAKGAVRTKAKMVWWNFTAVSETETLISHYSCVDPGGAIPGWARDLVVQKWCQSQILALVDTARKLDLPPVEAFVGWGAPKAVDLLRLKVAEAAPDKDATATAAAGPGPPFDFEP